MIFDINAVSDGLAVAKGISDFGLLAIAAGFFVVSSIIQQLLMNKRYNALQEQNDKRYNELFTKFLNSNGSQQCLQEKTEELINVISQLIDPLKSLLLITQNDVKEECTLPQAIKVLKGECALMRYNITDMVRAVIKKNNVHVNEQTTKEKCVRVVENAFRSSVSVANMFKYKSVKVGTLYQHQYKEQVVSVIYAFIMSEGQKNYDKFDSDMSVIFEELCSKSLESLNAL